MIRSADDAWMAGDAYEAYMGRWSRMVARTFVEWLNPKPFADWIEIGCGTGALTATICDLCEPHSVVACDPSVPFIEHARRSLPDDRVRFVVGGVEALPSQSGGFDMAVSALVLNFLPDPQSVIRSMAGRLRKGGAVAGYVWDYSDGMLPLRVFWEQAVALDPGASALDEGARFPLCRQSALETVWRDAGLSDVETRPLEIATYFATFEEYWSPFLLGTGPAPGYVASLAPDHRDSLRDRIMSRLPTGPDGSIQLRARAWAARGIII
ncbi:MAG TPA: class I SAM-dependent methyltransferase [Terriglobia bacterium]|nr:class I SAM-dependent methyltransferase [Terriglobia bacterium]